MREWHSLSVYHLHFPSPQEWSRPSGQEGPILSYPVWHLSLIDGLQMLSCEKTHFIVIKILFSVDDNVNSLPKMPTMSNWLSSEPIAWPCRQVSAKDSSLIPLGRQESSVEHLISFSVWDTMWITTKTFQSNRRECLRESCIPDQKEFQPLDPWILLNSLSSKEKHH